MKKNHYLSLLCIGLLTFLYCSNPVSKDPLKWRSAIEVPVSNENFNLKEQFNKLFNFDTMSVVDPDTSHLGDTLEFSLKKVDTTEFETHQDSIKKQTYQVKFGLITLTNVPKMIDTVTLPQAAGNFNVNAPVTVSKVYQATFYDTSVNTLSIRVENLSDAELSNFSVGIAGVDTQMIGSLGAKTAGIVTLNIRGKSIQNPLTFSLIGTSAAGGSKQLCISYSFDSLIVSRCKIDDHLININQEFFADYDITDTVAIDYVDIANGFFNYKISNYSNLELKFNVEHQYLWMTTYSESNKLETVNDVDNFSSKDSAAYSGRITSSPINVLPNTAQTVSTQNISSDRMFTRWDAKRHESYTKIKYTVTTPKPRGDTIEISADDSLSFTIYVTSFRFKEFLGTAMEDYVRTGDTQKVAIVLPKPMNNSIKDSLRGKFVFSKVDGNIFVKTDMPPRSYIDTLKVDFTAIPYGHEDVNDHSTQVFTNVNDTAAYKKKIDITNVTNQFPDTVLIATVVRVPKGTRMRVCDNASSSGDYSNYNSYAGQMNVKLLVNYSLNPRLDWTVVDTVNLDLGSAKFDVIDPLRFIRKLEDSRVLMNLRVHNNSNLNMCLYALVAPRRMIPQLDSMSTYDVVQLISHSGEAEKLGLVNFLGTNGVRIPKRASKDSTSSYTETEIELKDAQLKTMVTSDTCSWRWVAKFIKQDRDAMTDTDFIKINSMIHVEGTNNTDSLFIW